MAVSNTSTEALPVFRDPRDFDKRSGNWLERLVFNHRLVFLAVCGLLTLFLGYQATGLTINASFDKMIPQSHAYIKNYFDNRDKLGGLGNVVRVVIESKNGDIFQPEFLDTVKKVNDDLFLTPGVDRAWQKSIWMSGVRWMVATEEGFRGGAVMPDDYDGSPASMARLRSNIDIARLAGSLVGKDYKSVMIVVPLLEKDPATGKAMDYGSFSRGLEKNIRAKYSVADKVDIHIIGFAKMIGDLIDGMIQVLKYFGFAALVAAGIIYAYTRCQRSTALVLACSVVAVIWLLGTLRLLGMYLDPYSVLVPFLVFAIGVSHAAQKMNGIMQDVGRGTHKYVAARYTFRRLFLAGFTALLADAVGFGVLMVIDIPVIKDLALAASIGVAMLIVTNLLLLPVMLSFAGVSPNAAQRSLAREATEGDMTPRGMIGFIERFTTRRWATGAVLASLVMAVVGFWISLGLKIGDLDAGAPELRANSRYNRDVGYINKSYGLSSDQFVVIAKVPDQMCSDLIVMKKVENLSWKLRGVPGVQTVTSLSESAANFISGMQEDNPKWMSIPSSPGMAEAAAQLIITNIPDAVDTGCSTIPVSAYLADHKAETLKGVVAAVEEFAAENDNKDTKFLLAAGPAGIEAVTNIVVHDANRRMLLYVYAAVVLLCFITFRNWRAVLVAVIPLVVTSVLCEALMAMLGIGVKVATLPVIALGVGIGVDYALYLLSVQLQLQRAGLPLRLAYRKAMQFTGKVVALIGVTLAAGVITWAWSPIKFQADMGILLTFMFVWNMIGALIMIPALSHFLLRSKAEKTGKAGGQEVDSEGKLPTRIEESHEEEAVRSAKAVNA
ncbi:MAG TPA: MMPL family transporter [Noviherbaspirillum sp.]|uniref:efflux RND transporter permease subunit n=1 Tax=Noviherbaspirillum sp. TaxID=1926288 RepID=UPI002B490623|nr:MMPL family transporter [Noviherbaspirillum sp.]HJV86582.1 MMPL family transporter [Noviherbaspirillum sp.]